MGGRVAFIASSIVGAVVVLAVIVAVTSSPKMSVADQHGTAVAVANSTRVSVHATAAVTQTALARVKARQQATAQAIARKQAIARGVAHKTQVVAALTAAPQQTAAAQAQQTNQAIAVANAQATQQTQQRADANATAQASILVDQSGSGQWTSPKFNAPSDWTIDYSFDCSNFGSSGNFIVDVNGGDNGFSSAGVNELKMSGSGSTSVHDASGPGVYLDVNSECNWHIKAHA